MAVEAAEEIANGSRADIVAQCVALGLNIHPVEAQIILIDHAINAVVAATANSASGVRHGPAKTHAQKQIDDEPLEEIRRGAANALQKVLGKRCIDLAMRATHHF